MDSTIFICQLKEENQSKIKKLVNKYLTDEGYDNKDIEEITLNVMSDRLCLLSEVMDIETFLKTGKVIKIE